MSLKPIRIEYLAKGYTTGLTDVKAQVYLNGVAKAVGVNALVLSEVDATNAPGLYELLIAANTLTTWGVVSTQANYITGEINSATKPAPAPFKELVAVYNTDDLTAQIGAPVGASISADIAAVKADAETIIGDLETGSNSLANILAAIESVQNNAGFSGFGIPVPPQLIRPASGSNNYRIPLTFYDSVGNLIDPDTQSVVVTLVNQAGSDRSTMLVNNSGGSAPAVRDSLGQYHIDLAVPSTAAAEELIFGFAYAIGGHATARKSTSSVVSEVSAEGFALQTTLLDVQTDVSAIKTVVESATFGNAAIKTELDLVAIDAAAAAADSALAKTAAQNAETIVGSGTFGNEAIMNYLKANAFIGGVAV